MSAPEHADLVIRLDAGPSIGSGHFMRCLAYAAASEGAGLRIAFAVSDAESAAFAQGRGLSAEVLGGDKMALGPLDGMALGDYASSCGARAVLVDSYGVSTGFFSKLRQRFAGVVAYIDDLYSFSEGRRSAPIRLPVTHLVNYSFGASRAEYDGLYGESAKLLIGPSYAPVRPEFTGGGRSARDGVSRVLVTSGATNPDRFLERVAACCMAAVPDAEIDVVVGAMARVSGLRGEGGKVRLHHDVADMSGLMSTADIAVSAAGSTLYELACMGVPTIAVPIVENQVENARGFRDSGAGLALDGAGCIHDMLGSMVSDLAGRQDLRVALSKRALSIVDGLGANRVIEMLFGPRDIGGLHDGADSGRRDSCGAKDSHRA